MTALIVSRGSGTPAPEPPEPTDPQGFDSTAAGAAISVFGADNRFAENDTTALNTVAGALPRSSGKYQVEVEFTAGTQILVGVVNDTFGNYDSYIGERYVAASSVGWNNLAIDPAVYANINGAYSRIELPVGGYASGDVIGVAINLEVAPPRVSFYKNGVEAFGPFELVSGPWRYAVTLKSAGAEARDAADLLVYPIPGYLAWADKA